MPRVARPDEMPRAALSPANQPAQINTGVASRIGQAGQSMGRAVEAIGGAFGEVVGRIGQANDANAEANARLDWLKGSVGIDDDLRANAGEDGAAWQQSPQRYQQLNDEIDKKYPISDPMKRANFQRWRELQTFNRGQQAVRQYQDAQRGLFIKGFDADVAGLEERISRGEVEPGQFDEYYKGLTGKLDGMNRTVLNQSDVEAKSRELRARLVGAFDRHLSAKDPAERQRFWDQVRAGQYEIDRPQSQGSAPNATTGSGPDYRGQRGPAAIRYNNPGAMWPGPSSRKFGAVDTVTLNDGQGNKIAVFPDAVSGAAAQFDLLERKYTGKTLASAIRTWSGGNSSDAYAAKVAAETGLTPGTILTKDMIRDPRIAIPIARSMASMEAGRKEYPLQPGQWAQAHQIAFGGGRPAQQSGGGSDAPATPAAPVANDNDGDNAPEQAAETVESPLGGLADTIAEAAAKDPNAPVSSVIDGAQMAELAARIPELANAPSYDSMTVGQLAELAKGQAAPQARPGQPQVQGGGIPMGRLAPGQVFTVKTPRGEISIPSEWINDVPPKMREQMVRQSGEAYRLFERGRQSVATGMMEDAETHMAVHGRPHDGYDAATVQAAFARNPEALRKHMKRMAIAQGVQQEAGNFADMPSDEIAARLENLESRYLVEGETDAGAKKIVDLVKKRGDAMLKQRERDPAGSVEGSKEVQSVRSRLAGGQVRNKMEAIALMDARMEAQRRLDVPEGERSPISQREALALAPSLRGLNPGDALASIQKLHDRVKGMYGEKYSGLIVDRVIATTIREKQKRDQFGAMLRELDEDGKVSPVTLERMRNLEQIGRREGALSPGSPQKPEQKGVMGRLYDMLPSFGGSAEQSGPTGPTIWSPDFWKSSPQPQFPAPTPAHIELLKKNPQAIEDFEKKFGPGSADRAVPGLRRMILMNQAK